METRQSEDKDVLIRRAFFDAQSRRWGLVEVAHINARHAPARRGPVEGEIAMAVRALPVLDAALRSIIVLAESADKWNYGKADVIRTMLIRLPHTNAETY